MGAHSAGWTGVTAVQQSREKAGMERRSGVYTDTHDARGSGDAAVVLLVGERAEYSAGARGPSMDSS